LKTVQAKANASANASVFRNTLWMAWSGTINIANSLVIWLALARWRTAAEVGQFATVMSLFTIFLTVCGLGLTPYLTSELARRTERRRFLASVTLLIGGWSMLCLVLMIVAGSVTSANPAVRLATLVLSLALLPSGLISICEAIFTAFGQARVIAYATTTESLLRTVLPLALLYRGGGLVAVCLTFVLVRCAALVVYLIALSRRFNLFVRPTWPALVEIRGLAQAAPTFIGVTALAALHWQLGTVLAGKLGGEIVAADFGVAARFLVPAMVLLSSYVSVIQPTATRAAQQSRTDLGEFLARCLRLVLALALPVAVGGLTLGAELLTLLFGKAYASAALPLGLLAISVAPFSIVMIAARGLIATNRQRFDLLANASAVAVNLLANLLLIPRYGALGAAAAQLLSLVVMALIVVRWGTQPLFSLHIGRAVWICLWPLVLMLDVILLTKQFGFWWAFSAGAASYVLGLFVIREKLLTGHQAASSAEPRRRILLVGAHPTKTLGGISTLISDLLNSHLTKEFYFKHVVSQMDECGKWGKLLLAVAALGRFVWHLCTWRPDLVYVHVGGNASLYRKTLFIGLARLTGWRVLAHFHAGNFAPYFAAQSKLGQQLILRGLGLSHKFIAVSQEMAQWLGQLWPHAEISVIPNGVRTESFRVERTGVTDTPRLLFVGKMGFLKGEAELLRALQQVKAETQLDFRLDLVGQLSAEIGALIQTTGLAAHVDQFGPVALSDRIGYFQRADIFVLPTYAEGLSIAIIEALAAGLPVISTPVGGTPELITDGIEGFLVSPGDVPALAARLAQLLGDAALRQAMGARALRSASRYDLHSTLTQLGAELRQETEVMNLPPIEAIEEHTN
jgi:O-antigen/teichoic acid export membrane protein/glycosyltransferase involved in cell wall biosynthesis